MQDEQELMVEESVSLLDYLFPLIRWRWLIFGCCALFGLLGILSALSKAPYYTAIASFIPSGAMGEKDELDTLGGASGKNWAAVRSAGEMVKYYDISLKARPLMETMLKRSFSTIEHGDVTLAALLSKGAADATPEQAIVALRKKLTVGSGGGKVLTVAYSCGEPQLSADVVNALLQSFEQQPRGGQRASADMEFVQARIADVLSKLESKEKAIAEGKSMSLDSGQPDAIRRLAALEREARLLEKLYESLNAEFAKAEIRVIQSQQETGREIDIIEPAEAPLERAGPNRMKILVVFGFIGFVLSSGAAFVIEYFANMQRVFRDHPFWALLKKARRDLIVMAILLGLLLIAAVLYRSLG